ncbi:MAG TPA: MerR family transcriptional regulator [Nitrospira sp.]|nr:MerR family transcriptional regulator [Nitrospira sp. NTP1]HQR14494.1 MerR family transcriptional regulator [Nitrospira sp.]HQV12732.1 MerR family transcriptional regulator [Nitrospira sp.]
MKKVNEGPKKKLYKTNEVCEMFDISRATLFRWEREGLITGPPRDWRNWRLYTAENVEQIKHVMSGGRKDVA